MGVLGGSLDRAPKGWGLAPGQDREAVRGALLQQSRELNLGTRGRES